MSSNRLFLDDYQIYKLQKLFKIYLMSDNPRGLQFTETNLFKELIKNQQKYALYSRKTNQTYKKPFYTLDGRLNAS